jgi:predicted ArsR family transcriptional regulator
VELQETRRHILEILRQQGECTVEDLVKALSQRLARTITPVTTRHHLDILQAEGLLEAPQPRRRNAPGRPQYVYRLTPKAADYFPNNYAGFADSLLTHVKAHLPPSEINVILQEMAQEQAAAAHIPSALPFTERLDVVVKYLSEQGYQAYWELAEGGWILATSNCPYERLIGRHEDLCQFDLRLVASLLGVVPRFMGSQREGEAACRYFIPASALAQA